MDNTNWLILILLILLIEPLRDTLWVFLVMADPLMLLLILAIIWYLARD